MARVHPRFDGRHAQPRSVPVARAVRRTTVPPSGHTALAEQPVRHNLPAELSSLVGREQDVATLKPLLEDRKSRLVTLTGPGGVGKTRLGQRLGSLLVDAFPDGVWLVELAGVADPNLVAETAATTLGIRGVRDAEQGLIAALRTRQVLLIVDNCEHLLARCASLTTVLLRRCPDLCVLATSRESLQIAGEVTWPLASLALPSADASFDELLGAEAVDLFAQRARAAQPGFALTASNAPIVVELCRRLDGLPLALELAAAAIPTLAVGQLASRLATRLDLLTGGPSSPPRHQTLTAALTWSYDLLSPHEQLLLRRLSVFSGGCTLEAVESVCADDALEAAQVVPVLRRLAARSLVAAEADAAGNLRYRLLELVRAFALDLHVRSGESALLQARHFEYFADLVERLEPVLHGPEQAQLANLLERELDNLRSALDWSESGLNGARARGLRLATLLRYFWFMRGHLREGADRLRHGLEADAAGDDGSLRGRALCTLGFLLVLRGEHDDARTQLEAALNLGQELEDAWIVGFASRYLGLIATAAARYADARVLLEASLQRYRGIQSADDIALTLMYLGDVALHEHDAARAQRLFEESRAQLEQLQNRTVLPYPLRRLGQLARLRGDLRLAVQLCLESLAYNRAVGEQQGVAASLVGLALVAEVRGHSRTAAHLLGKADALLTSFGSGLLPFDEQELQLARERIRARMEPEAWDAAHAEGVRLSLEDILLAIEGIGEVPPAAGTGLTLRQAEILRLVALGHTNREIAATLSLSLATVERHLANIYTRIGARGRADATLYAARAGLLKTDP
ncbi:MAG TPA: LuxR C-terminal-related transcriptional regulator [Chloroflexota bacterium]|jgi:predicted ATPase/DNA-binding CsgD family transcriptional regulator